MKIELGTTGKDIITGFKGVITGHVKYLTGCDQILLVPRVDEKGARIDSHWFDINRIEAVEGEKKVVIDTTDESGPGELPPDY